MATPGWRRLSPGERKLERVKADARSSLGERTTQRLAELSIGTSQRQVSSTRGASEAGSSETSHIRQHQPPVVRHRGEGEVFIKERDDKNVILRREPSTEAKRNITQRRSRGRNEEPSGRLPQDLTAKRLRRGLKINIMQGRVEIGRICK